jgi:hypothetical protein
MLENLAEVAFLSYVLMQFVQTLVKPAIDIINLALENGDWRGALLKLWPMYVTTIIAGAIGWHAHYNLLPVLDEPLGSVLTAIGIGLGPSFLYDLQDNV